MLTTMTTSTSRKRSVPSKSATATDAPSKSPAKSPPNKTPPAKSDPPAKVSLLTTMRAALPALSDVEVRAFRTFASPAECRTRGLETRAADTYRDVTRALTRGRVDEVVRAHGEALGYDAPRLAFLLDATAAVGEGVAAQKQARGTGADTKLAVAQAEAAATAARNALLKRLKRLAGRNEASRAALDAARGKVDSAPALIDSLRSLSKLAQAWLDRDDPE